MPTGLSASGLAGDVRTSLRGLLRRPALALTIVLTVGIGLGATTAIFSAVNAALLQPLPYSEPERLVRIYTHAPPNTFRFSAVDYLALRDQQRQFAGLATYTDRSVLFADGRSAEVVRARIVSWTFLSVLGQQPAIGRDFQEADAQPGASPAVIVSNGFWQQRLGGRNRLGEAIRLDGRDHVVVGVLPERSGPLERRQDVFVVQQFEPPPRRGPFLYTVVGRLRRDAIAAHARDELRAINARIFPIWRSSYQDARATWEMEDLRAAIVGDVHKTAALVLAAVGFVWLIACSNASHLLLTRVSGRRRELAVRQALGASSGRILRHLFVESALLGGGAAAIGGGVAWAGIRVLRSAGTDYVPRAAEIAMGGPEWGLLAAMAICTALMFTAIPAASATLPVVDAVRASDRWATADAGAHRLRHSLVAAQFAVATPLLVAAALLLTSLDRLHQVDLGFDRDNVLTGSIRLAAAQYRDPSSRQVFWDRLTRQMAALPGVIGIAYADGLPPNGVGNINNFDLEDVPTAVGQSQPTAPWVAATPTYFGVLGLALHEGRLLDERDALAEDLTAVVVDRAWARRFFPGSSAVGRRFREGGCISCPWTEVVGVVSDVKYVGLDQPDQGTVYTAMSPQNLSRFLVVRAERDAGALLPSLQRVIRDADPGAALSSVATVDELVARAVDRPQSLSALVASFASIALVLSIIGVYGVMGNYVQQHLREIAIRMALGGSARDVMRLVVGNGMGMVAAGVVSGLALSLAVSRLVAAHLFDISATEPAAYAAVGFGLVAIALAACCIPAVRATRVQPSRILGEA